MWIRQSPSFLLKLFLPRFLSLAKPVGHARTETRERAATLAGGGTGVRDRGTSAGISAEAGCGTDLAG
jgi:hypothetical protein